MGMQVQGGVACKAEGVAINRVIALGGRLHVEWYPASPFGARSRWLHCIQSRGSCGCLYALVRGTRRRLDPISAAQHRRVMTDENDSLENDSEVTESEDHLDAADASSTASGGDPSKRKKKKKVPDHLVPFSSCMSQVFDKYNWCGTEKEEEQGALQRWQCIRGRSLPYPQRQQQAGP